MFMLKLFKAFRVCTLTSAAGSERQRAMRGSPPSSLTASCGGVVDINKGSVDVWVLLRPWRTEWADSVEEGMRRRYLVGVERSSVS